jgi:hypothetical protein
MLLRVFRIVSVLGYILWAIVAGPAESQQPASQQPSQQLTLLAASLPTPSTSAPGWTPDRTLGDTLRHLADHAAVAFVGTVQRIEPPSAAHPSTVVVTFTVLQPILGSPGTAFTLREWAGLWTMGRQRYTTGERALFFFHPPNAAGLSSPVDGMEGIVPFIPTSADAAPLLDIRRLGTRILRRVGDPLPFADTGVITLADATAVLTHPGDLLEPTPLPLPAGIQPIVTSTQRSPVRDQHIATPPSAGGSR